jgi:HSP20 family molecular chaperone IbpA
MAHVWVKAAETWPGTSLPSACVMTAEVAQNDREFRIVVALPGCDEKHLQVTATKSLIAVEGSIPPADRLNCEEVLFSEFAGRRLTRSFALPEDIAPEEVKAHLRNGFLTIVALKARAARTHRAAYAMQG